MKALFLTTHLNTGGITSYLMTVAAGLRENGHQVWIVSSGGNTEESFRSMGVTLVTMPIKTKSELSWRIYAALKPIADLIHREKIDVIHAHTRITQVMGYFLQRRTGCAFITTCHGFFKPRFFRRIFPCWGQRVIAISKAVEDHLVHDFRVPKERVVLVESGVDTKQFYVASLNEKQSIRNKFRFTNEKLIGMVARFSEVKGQDILIRAAPLIFQAIPNARILLIGEGKTEGELRSLVAELRLEEKVLFYPIVNRTQEVLGMLDVFVMPSRQEGLGLSVMEAQAAGLAVVASNVGGLPTLVKDGHTGYLFSSGSESELAKKIVRLLNDSEGAQRMGHAARENVLAEHSAERMVGQIEGIYREVMHA